MNLTQESGKKGCYAKVSVKSFSKILDTNDVDVVMGSSVKLLVERYKEIN
ncbi:MAG: hypothetical protein HN931_11235 [Desulfobacterales bacterium]|nr:hypothetical protein [Desulfobacteraceae bacterium]MBT7086738.1 hypothetical protein [Desulfobacterales bacterium]